MNNEEKEKMLRVQILGTLVTHSGKPLTPDLIGQLATEIVELAHDIWDKNEIDR